MIKQYQMIEKNTAELLPYINNARTHSETQIKQIAASIKEFGFTNPVLIDDNNMIIAGHGRVEAAQLLNMKTIPAIVLKDLSETQKKAYIIADNKLALNAGWDEALLAAEIENLKNEDFDLDLLGFDDDELSELIKEYDEADYPELKEGDKDPFTTMTFIIHDDLLPQVKQALEIAITQTKSMDGNRNANALYQICNIYLKYKND
jgi:ParB family chromosome partitioning protein